MHFEEAVSSRSDGIPKAKKHEGILDIGMLEEFNWFLWQSSSGDLVWEPIPCRELLLTENMVKGWEIGSYC